MNDHYEEIRAHEKFLWKIREGLTGEELNSVPAGAFRDGDMTRLLAYVPRTRAAYIQVMREVARLRGEVFEEPRPLPSVDRLAKLRGEIERIMWQWKGKDEYHVGEYSERIMALIQAYELEK